MLGYTFVSSLCMFPNPVIYFGTFFLLVLITFKLPEILFSDGKDSKMVWKIQSSSFARISKADSGRAILPLLSL